VGSKVSLTLDVGPEHLVGRCIVPCKTRLRNLEALKEHNTHQVHLHCPGAGGVRRAGAGPPGGRDTTAEGRRRSAARYPRRTGTEPLLWHRGDDPPEPRLKGRTAI
jgi:hypothetical protein